MDLQLEGNCYVLLQGNWIHPIAHRRHELMWYPERSMSLLECQRYRPYVKSVVTEDASIIAMYPREKVWVMSDHNGRWENPVDQTYGGSRSYISSILGLYDDIPAMALDGGKRLEKFCKEYHKRVLMANKYYS
jgi:hypothetical protein